jgi:hypothetical protein
MTPACRSSELSLLEPRLVEWQHLGLLESFLDLLLLGLLPEESLEDSLLPLSLGLGDELGLLCALCLEGLLLRLELDLHLGYLFLSLIWAFTDENDGCENDEEEEWLLDLLLRGDLDFPSMSTMILRSAFFCLGLDLSSLDESSQSS